MHTFHRLLILSGVVSCALAAVAQSATPSLPAADAIMARIAANQDRAEAERSRYIYVQHAKMTSRKGKRVMCEETTDYRVTPSGSDSHFELMKLNGRVWHKGQYVAYDHLAPNNDGDADDAKNKNAKAADGKQGGKTAEEAAKQSDKKPANKTAKKSDTDSKDPVLEIDSNGDLDRELVENMRHGLLDSKSKDGVDSDLFPLTSKEQKDYAFQLIGKERMNGHDVYHVTFRPKDKSDISWKGDAYVDETTFEPVLVTTGLSRKIPLAVRMLLGTNVPGLGFTIVYAPQGDGVWFPSTFSTEFKIRVLFFFHREILLDAQNRDFEKTHVESKILEGVTPVDKQ